MSTVLGAVFFGPGNHAAGHPKLGASDWRAACDHVGSHTVVLPRVHDSGDVSWYVLAPDDVHFDEARETVTAFLGHSYSEFRGEAAEPDSADPIDIAVDEAAGGRWFRVAVRQQDIDSSIRAVSLLKGLLAAQPRRGQALPRPIGRMLRDIEMALGVGRFDEATRLVNQVEERGVLGRRNLTFLRVRVASERQRFDQVFELPDLVEVVAGRRPSAVTESLLVAVYQHFLAGFEKRDSPSEQLAFFRAHVYPQYGEFFGTRSGTQHPEALKAFALGLIAERAEGVMLDEVHALLESRDRAWVERVRQSAAAPEPTAEWVGPVQQAEALVRDRRYDRALALVESLPPSTEVFRVVLECAPEVNTQAAADTCFRVREALSDSEFAEVVAGWRTRVAWEHLVEQFGESGGPRDWASWFEGITDGNASVGIAVEEGERWALGEGDVSELLLRAWVDRAEEVNRVLPQLVACITTTYKEGGLSGARLRGLCDQIAEIIAADDLSLISDLDAVLKLTDVRLDAGLVEADYAKQVSLLLRIWKTFEAPKYFEWALEAVELLAYYPSPRPAERRALFQTVVGSAVRFARHLDRATRRVLVQLCGELGVADQRTRLEEAWREVTEATEESVDLGDRYIVIYTLTERAGRSAREVLRGLYPGVRVELSHDKVGSPRLKEFARNADLFVMCTWSAKHAATEFIAHERGHKPIGYPQGKGMSSILRVVTDWASAQ
ncbi:MAG: hypothetical protein EP330_08715 [Deltaproteobacteria bacterium]|nr:MAG: hypothetical protein EP330_08715 [Deltaproteobacteria bacterium]